MGGVAGYGGRAFTEGTRRVYGRGTGGVAGLRRTSVHGRYARHAPV